MILFNLPKLGFDRAYFKSPRNWYHLVVGIAIKYFFSILIFCNREEFPISAEYWWNYLYPFICSIPVYFIAFYGEQKQDEATGKSVSDMRDVFFTGFPSVLGGYLSMCFASWYLAISLIIIALLLIIFKHKK